MAHNPARLLRRLIESGGDDVDQLTDPDRQSITSGEAVLEHSPAVAFAWRADTVWSIAYVSTNIIQWGYTPAQLTHATEGFAALIDARDQQAVSLAVADAVAAGEVHLRHEYRLVKSDGARVSVFALVHILRDDNLCVQGFDGLLLDITTRKAREEHLSLRERAFDAIDVGITIGDAQRPDWPLIYASRGFTELTGYAEEDIVGRNCRVLQGDDREQVQRSDIRWALAHGHSTQVILRNYRRDGSLFWNELNISPVFDEAGKVSHFVGIQMNVSQRISERKRLRDAEYTDYLTGFNNREGFELNLNRIVSEAKAGDYAVAVVDIRDMQGINSTRGSQVGDWILVEMAQRCQAAVPHAVIGRLGGDRMAVAEAEAVGEDANLDSLARRVLDALEAQLVVQGMTFKLAFAIGCAHADRATRVDTAITRADIARKAAKQADGASIRVFSQDMAFHEERRVQLTDALRHAVEGSEFELHIQPKIALDDGRLVGAEALLRWNHPTFGMQSPAIFIPLAESSGLIVPIGEWALHRLCALVAQLDAAGTPPPPLALNVSAIQVGGGNIGDSFPKIVAQYDLDPARIILELTESAFAGGPETTRVLDQLAASGFGIALDDFGTGYSALSALQGYPLNEIKIDGSFIGYARTNAYSHNIVVMIQRIAETLQCRTVAEGVETHEDLQTIRAIGCDEGQGFYFTYPLTAERFVEYLAGKGPVWDVE